MKLINQNFLTESSKLKLRQLNFMDKKISPNSLHPKLIKLLNQMIDASRQKIFLGENKQPISLENLQQIFINFDQELNDIKDSKLINDVKLMKLNQSLNLKINQDNIEINFIFGEKSKNYLPIIIHAINTFCHLFQYHYDGLVINICLDDNERKIEIPNNVINFDKKIKFLKKNSQGLNVSGVTYRNKKSINLTRTEEIIKLLFHELIHFVELDINLLNEFFTLNWLIDQISFNLSEAYTEFLSIILSSAYQSIFISVFDQLNISSIYQIYAQLLYFEKIYSIYLTANILKFYGFDQKNYNYFFDGDKSLNTKCWAPIAIWEYIFLRTIFFLHLDEMMEIIPNDFRLNCESVNQIKNLLEKDNDLINQLAFFMGHTKPIKNISYMMINFNWTKI